MDEYTKVSDMPRTSVITISNNNEKHIKNYEVSRNGAIQQCDFECRSIIFLLTVQLPSKLSNVESVTAQYGK